MAEQTRAQAPVKTTAQLAAETPDPRADAAAEQAPEKAPEPDTSGKRVRAIPTHGGTSVEITEAEFAQAGIQHRNVEWSFDKDNWTVPVGEDGISEEAADKITKLEPTRFEYINNG